MREEWALEIRDACAEQDVDFFFKEWGGGAPKTMGRLMQGQEYNAPRAIGSLPTLRVALFCTIANTYRECPAGCSLLAPGI